MLICTAQLVFYNVGSTENTPGHIKNFAQRLFFLVHSGLLVFFSIFLDEVGKKRLFLSSADTFTHVVKVVYKSWFPPALESYW